MVYLLLYYSFFDPGSPDHTSVYQYRSHYGSIQPIEDFRPKANDILVNIDWHYVDVMLKLKKTDFTYTNIHKIHQHTFFPKVQRHC